MRGASWDRMAAGTEQGGTRPRGGRRRRAVHALAGLFAMVAVLLLVLGLSAALVSQGRLALPGWVTEQVQARINARLGGARVDLGRVELVMGDGLPRLSLRNLVVSDASGGGLAQVNELGAAFDPAGLARGQIVPRRLRISGAQVTVRRTADGGFLLSLGEGGSRFPGLGGLLDGVDAVLDRPPFDRIEAVEARDLTVTLEDARSARVWQGTGGRLLLERTPRGTDLTVFTEIFNGTDAMGRAQLSVSTARDSGAASIAATLTNAAAGDIALQSPVLSFLGVLQAPISGAIRTTLDEDGAPEDFAATLEIGKGALQPVAGARPVRFDRAKAYFGYDPAAEKITFSQIDVESEALRLQASGHAYLRERGPDGWPRALVGQVGIGSLALTQPGLFAGPLSFSGGAVDARVRLDPFGVEIGQLVLTGGEARRLTARGRVAAAPEGWSAALDLSAEELPAAQLTRLWPLPLAAKTRDWLAENVRAGRIRNFDGALRLAAGGKPALAASFAFTGAELRFLPEMPLLTGAAGYGAIQDNRFSLTLDEGEVTPEMGGALQLGGSTMVVPDVKEKPARGEFDLAAKGSTTAVLSLLTHPPVNLFADGGRVDLAEGQADLQVKVNTIFAHKDDPGWRPPDYRAEGVLSGVSSEVLVPKHRVEAGRLSVEATPSAVLIEGPARFDGLPLTARWRQGMAPEERGSSELRGTVQLSAQAARTFRLGLPEGMISGSGPGEFRITLPKDGRPAFRLSSDLEGVGLALPAIGWRKPAAATGRLAVEGRLGADPSVDRLEVEGGGLSASGRLDLGKGGAFRAAIFDRVRVGGWLDAPVTLTARQGGSPAIALNGGSFDLSRADLGGSGGGGGGGGGAHGPISLALDRLQVSQGIALTGVRGQVDAGRGVTGRITARVNGGTPVSATMVAGQRGTAVRILSDDAGGVFRDAGLLKMARGGALDLTLTPTGAPGTYDGTLGVEGTRVKDAPAMAELLSAISVVGLLEQLDGQGIPFDEVRASFRLDPRQVTLYRSSAVGASLGISLDGVYDLGSKRMDMQGVLSPVYILNGIGSIFTRRGEGLFGFNFRLTGPSAAPKVQVNPLSILTPGMFREIFRRPPPKRN